MSRFSLKYISIADEPPGIGADPFLASRTLLLDALYECATPISLKNMLVPAVLLDKIGGSDYPPVQVFQRSELRSQVARRGQALRLRSQLAERTRIGDLMIT